MMVRNISQAKAELSALIEEVQKGHEVILAVSGERSDFVKGLGIDHRVLPDIQEGDGAGYPTAEWFRDPARMEACIRAETALIKDCRPDRVLGVFRFTARAHCGKSSWAEP